MKRYLYKLAALFPLLFGAQRIHAQGKTVLDIIDVFDVITRGFMPIIFTLALLLFFWGLAIFIIKSGDDNAIAEGKKTMLWGVIAIFVIASLWGIIFFAGMIFGLGEGGSCPPPQIGENDVSTCF